MLVNSIYMWKKLHFFFVMVNSMEMVIRIWIDEIKWFFLGKLGLKHKKLLIIAIQIALF